MSNSEKENQTAEPSTEQPVTDEKPYSIWGPRERLWIVLAASIASFLSPLSSSIYFPALNSIAEDLNVTVTKVNLTVTTYMVSGLFNQLQRQQLIEFARYSKLSAQR